LTAKIVDFLIFTVKFVGEAELHFSVKSAWMLILGLAAMDGAFEAARKIKSARRYEFR